MKFGKEALYAILQITSNFLIDRFASNLYKFEVDEVICKQSIDRCQITIGLKITFIFNFPSWKTPLENSKLENGDLSKFKSSYSVEYIIT